jgi:hypothetical protein
MTEKEMTPDQVAELMPLRRVVAAQFARPVMPTERGFSDLVDRVTVAVAAHLDPIVPSTAEQARRLADAVEPPFACPECGEPYRPVLVGTPDQGLSCTHRSGCTWWSTRSPEDVHRFPQEYRGGTVDGIRPHRTMTPEQDTEARRAAERWEEQNPMTPERAAALLAGRQSPTSCLGCGQPWIDAVVRHLPDCPEAIRLRAAAPSTCPGCGQLSTRTAMGRYTRHLASCSVTSRDRS